MTQETLSKTTNNVRCFSFGDPVPVLQSRLHEYLGTCLSVENGSYYDPPVSLTGLARLLGANAYHWPLLEFKVNMTLRAYTRPSPLLPYAKINALVSDYMVFTNAYLLRHRSVFGDVVDLEHLPAINVRRLREADRYCLLHGDGSRTIFPPGEVIHIKSYDVRQNIYGVPSYIGAIQSLLLNEDTTLFRRRYYLNGGHLGYIFYSSSAGLEEEQEDAIAEAIKRSKGAGNFRNLFLHVPNGREKDFQILPVGDFSAKDQFEKIKNLSRDDIVAAHRIPAALANIVPAEARGGYGDISKADAVYEKNEIVPIRQRITELNKYLPKKQHIIFDDAGDA